MPRILNSAFFFFAVFFFTLGIAFYYGFGSSARTALIEQMLHREQVIARSGANSIESFFLLSGRSLSSLAQDKKLPGRDQETQKALEEFMAVWKDSPIPGVVLVDEKGIVRFNANIYNKPDVGATVKDRDYFTWAKTAKEKEVYFGTPVISRVGASEGEYIVPVASPLISDGQFKGVLTAAVILSQLTNDYLQPLKISDQTEVYILDSQGVFISALDGELIGKNVYQYLDENPFLGSAVLKEEFKKRVAEKGEGKLQVAWLDTKGNSNIFSRKLLAYSPFSLGKQSFFLAIVTPVDDALVYIGPIYMRQNVGFVISFLAVLMVVVRLAKIYAYKEAMKIKREEKPSN